MNMNLIKFAAVSLDELREAHRQTVTEGKRFQLKDKTTGNEITFKTMLSWSNGNSDRFSFSGFGGDYQNPPGLGRSYVLEKNPEDGSYVDPVFHDLELLG